MLSGHRAGLIPLLSPQVLGQERGSACSSRIEWCLLWHPNPTSLTNFLLPPSGDLKQAVPVSRHANVGHLHIVHTGTEDAEVKLKVARLFSVALSPREVIHQRKVLN